MPIAELENGRRIQFTLKRRDRDPFYLACFAGPRGKRLERSTKATNQKKAELAAVAIVRQAYSQPVHRESVGWDDAIARMVRHMTADNLRPGTIEQYKVAVRNLRKEFPETKGPHEITPAMAEDYKVKRVEAGKSERTVAGNLTNLSIVYGRWWRDTCKIVNSDPFADVKLPKQDKPAPRLIDPQEQMAFHEWLSKRWGWRTPLLFLEIKAAIGCRISELAELPAANLVDGRVVFVAETTKGRKQRAPKLPPALYAELKALAKGQTYAFERFSEQLREIHLDRGLHRIAERVKTFSPRQLRYWLQENAKTYFKKTKAKRFKLHNLRGTAMSRARMLGIGCDDAAISFGCNPDTMRKHYLAIVDRGLKGSHFRGPKRASYRAAEFRWT